MTERALDPIRYVLIGASTGGPELLHRILSALAAPFPLAVLITQHTLEGFDDSLAQWLSGTGHVVRVAREGDVACENAVLLAPADKHMKVTLHGVTLVHLAQCEMITSVDTMFKSAAQVWGPSCLAFLLSGMGKDGAQGMRAVRERGGLTVAQRTDSCVVASMPDSARALGAARLVLSPDGIIGLLQQLVAATSARRIADHQKGK